MYRFSWGLVLIVDKNKADVMPWRFFPDCELNILYFVLNRFFLFFAPVRGNPVRLLEETYSSTTFGTLTFLCTFGRVPKDAKKGKFHCISKEPRSGSRKMTLNLSY